MCRECGSRRYRSKPCPNAAAHPSVQNQNPQCYPCQTILTTTSCGICGHIKTKRQTCPNWLNHPDQQPNYRLRVEQPPIPQNEKMPIERKNIGEADNPGPIPLWFTECVVAVMLMVLPLGGHSTIRLTFCCICMLTNLVRRRSSVRWIMQWAWQAIVSCSYLTWVHIDAAKWFLIIGYTPFLWKIIAFFAPFVSHVIVWICMNAMFAQFIVGIIWYSLGSMRRRVARRIQRNMNIPVPPALNLADAVYDWCVVQWYTYAQPIQRRHTGRCYQRSRKWCEPTLSYLSTKYDVYNPKDGRCLLECLRTLYPSTKDLASTTEMNKELLVQGRIANVARQELHNLRLHEAPLSFDTVALFCDVYNRHVPNTIVIEVDGRGEIQEQRKLYWHLPKQSCLVLIEQRNGREFKGHWVVCNVKNTTLLENTCPKIDLRFNLTPQRWDSKIPLCMFIPPDTPIHEDSIDTGENDAIEEEMSDHDIRSNHSVIDAVADLFGCQATYDQNNSSSSSNDSCSSDGGDLAYEADDSLEDGYLDEIWADDQQRISHEVVQILENDDQDDPTYIDIIPSFEDEEEYDAVMQEQHFDWVYGRRKDEYLRESCALYNQASGDLNALEGVDDKLGRILVNNRVTIRSELRESYQAHWNCPVPLHCGTDGCTENDYACKTHFCTCVARIHGSSNCYIDKSLQVLNPETLVNLTRAHKRVICIALTKKGMQKLVEDGDTLQYNSADPRSIDFTVDSRRYGYNQYLFQDCGNEVGLRWSKLPDNQFDWVIVTDGKREQYTQTFEVVACDDSPPSSTKATTHIAADGHVAIRLFDFLTFSKSGTLECVVPTQFLDMVAAKISLVDRSSASLANLSAYCREKMKAPEHAWSIPKGQTALYHAVITTAAFSWNGENEAILTTALRHFRPQADIINEHLKFESVSWWHPRNLFSPFSTDLQPLTNKAIVSLKSWGLNQLFYKFTSGDWQDTIGASMNGSGNVALGVMEHDLGQAYAHMYHGGTGMKDDLPVCSKCNQYVVDGSCVCKPGKICFAKGCGRQIANKQKLCGKCQNNPLGIVDMLYHNSNVCLSTKYSHPVKGLRVPAVKAQQPLKPQRPKTQLIAGEARKGNVYYGMTLSGVGFPYCRPVVTAKTVKNEKLALQNRALADTVQPCVPRLRQFKRWVIKHKYVLFPGIKYQKPKSFIEWSNHFPLAKRNLLHRGRASLKQLGLRKKNFTRKTFIKRELLLKAGLFGPVDYAPRVIQAVSPEANCALGPCISSYQEYLKTVWNTDFPILFGCGLNSEQLGQWMSKLQTEGKVMLEDDFTLYDSTISTHLLDVERTVYNWMGMRRHYNAVKTMDAQFQTKGYTAMGLKYEVEGTRKSGDPNTTLGNSIINALSHLFVLHQARGGRLTELMLECKILVGGDDNLMVIPEDINVDWVAKLAELGLVSKMVTREDKEQLTFFSSRGYPSSSGVVFAPKLGKFLAKVGWNLDNYPDEQMWWKDVRAGWVNTLHHVPIARVLVEGLQQSNIKVQDWELKAKTQNDVTAETWAFFEKVYQLNQTEILEIEHQLRSTPVPGIMHHPALERVFDADCS